MNADRELLELAAKAAGVNARWFNVKQWQRKKSHPNCRFYCGTKEVFGTHHSKPWNPLTDDGDALRLAAKLKIDIEWQATQVGALPLVEAYRGDPGGGSFCACENEADYRIAIVLAAAEIGRRQA